MREIKFRGVMKLTRKYIYGWGCLTDESNRKMIIDDKRSFILVENIEQSTGLKDKNGKEIYEGDIITKKYDSYVHKLAVEWNDYGGFSELYCANDFEIIGNIYEHSHLLNDNS